MTIKKNDIIETEIIDITSDGYGVCKINGVVVFVDKVAPLDKCQIKILKVKKNLAYGKLIKLLEPSIYREKPICDVFDKCGGCSLQHIQYKYQLQLKETMLKESLKRISNINCDLMQPIVSFDSLRYRNKVIMPVGQNGEVGFYKKNTHIVINNYDCHLAPKINEQIIKVVTLCNIPIYNETNHTEGLRHIFIRHGDEQIMVGLILNAKNNSIIKNLDILVNNLKEIKNVSSIILNYNTKKNNVLLGEKEEVVFGKNYIQDTLGNIKFNISLKSFYQINKQQAYNLYTKIRSLVENDDIVIDAYCGIGTISLFLAQKTKKVYGVEIVPQAIEDAKKNALNNNIYNVEFILGKAEEVIPTYFKEKKIDVIVVDPPRKGCGKQLLDAIINFLPTKIIYVSCHHGTLSRDLKILIENGYEIIEIVPYDFFPQTTHVECVALMTRK